MNKRLCPSRAATQAVTRETLWFHEIERPGLQHTRIGLALSRPSMLPADRHTGAGSTVLQAGATQQAP